jgi:hypothetical protein
MLQTSHTPIHAGAKYKHEIHGVDNTGKEFVITQHNNKPVTVTKAIVVYFNKHNYIFLNSKRYSLN